MFGTSLLYSCHAYEQYKDTADINIIQMTGPHRITYYTPLLDPFYLPLGQVTNNYNKITDQRKYFMLTPSRPKIFHGTNTSFVPLVST